jgi:predicted amidohydrolase
MPEPHDKASLRIALFQGPADGTDVLGSLDEQARAARAGGAALLVLWEMALTGYDIGPARVRAGAVAADGPVIGRVREIAARHGLAILLGYPELGPDGAVYNAAFLALADGRAGANYRKRHLFGSVDRDAFSTGGVSPSGLVRIGPFTAGILICYDAEFPEAVRDLVLAGADLVLVPTALMEPYEIVPRMVMPVRAFENGVFVAYCNRCGTEGRFTYTGLSCVAAPDGTVLARAGQGEELIFADLDPAAIGHARELTAYLADRRPELYGRLVAGADA